MDTRQISLFRLSNDDFPDNDASHNIEDATLDAECNQEALALLSVCFREICTAPQPRTQSHAIPTSLHWRDRLQMEDQILDENSPVPVFNALREEVSLFRDQTEIFIEDIIADIHRKMSIKIIGIGMPVHHQRPHNDAVAPHCMVKSKIVFMQENVLLDFKMQPEIGEIQVYGCIFDAVCEAIKDGSDISQLKIAVCRVSVGNLRTIDTTNNIKRKNNIFTTDDFLVLRHAKSCILQMQLVFRIVMQAHDMELFLQGPFAQFVELPNKKHSKELPAKVTEDLTKNVEDFGLDSSSANECLKEVPLSVTKDLTKYVEDFGDDFSSVNKCLKDLVEHVVKTAIDGSSRKGKGKKSKKKRPKGKVFFHTKPRKKCKFKTFTAAQTIQT